MTVYLGALILLTLSGATFLRAFVEARLMDREVTRLGSYYAAEAGLQTAMAQIDDNDNAHTGYIEDDDIDSTALQSAGGASVGTFNVVIEYLNQADWVSAYSTATVNGHTVRLEARIFLQSNLSKYMMYSTAIDHGLAGNLQIGFANTEDGHSPTGVPANEIDRNLLYYTGNLNFNGSTINIYGDPHVEGVINMNSGSSRFVYGDAYITSFSLDAQGHVDNDGINGTLPVNDGFDDDVDRSGNGIVDSADAPDIHDLYGTNEQGADDAQKKESITALNMTFYQTNNAVPEFAGQTAQNRYLKFEVNGSTTRIVEYQNASYTTPTGNTYDLPTSDATGVASAIVYINGRAFIKGEIQGRVTVVSSDDILFTGNTKYANNQNYVDTTHSVAFLARDEVLFLPPNLDVSGIVYAERTDPNSQPPTTAGVAITAGRRLDTSGSGAWVTDEPDSNPNTKSGGIFHHYGNIIMLNKSSIATSAYGTRVFDYDPKMKYYRPPGIPVKPELRITREAAPIQNP